MKRVLSISLGSSKRDKSSTVKWLGEEILLERMGTDGNIKRAQELFRQYDGKVDAFGLGGADLSLSIQNKRYPIHSVKSVISNVKETPIVDGSGLKNTLEKQIGNFMAAYSGKKVLMTSSLDRWGMTQSFLDHEFEVVFGDFMFALNIPIALRSVRVLKLASKCLLPIVTRLPFKMLYPIGANQEINTPMFANWFNWASIIAGDCHFIKRYMPKNLDGKIIITNTTTEADRESFRNRGVKTLVTTTPIIDGRSFGTNVIEAALTAIAGKHRPLILQELEEFVSKLQLKPTMVSL